MGSAKDLNRSIVHFGGPDLPRGALRDVLEQHIDAVPSGGTIDWATYYFRDQELARALVRAKRRGVRVHVVVEAAPRERDANESVARTLRQRSGIGFGFHRFEARKWHGRVNPKCHLHSKIYVFSHPEPHVLLGSFNPSGNGVDDDPKIIESIGDQDRGHNLLVENRDRVLVEAMRRQVVRLPWLGWPPAARHHPGCQRVIRGNARSAWMFPRRVPGAIEPLFATLGEGDRLRVAVSHIKTEYGLGLLCGAANNGARVQVILHHANRRAPIETEEALRNAGAEVLRYRHALELPMHAKFMMFDRPGDGGAAVCSTYGSLNLNARSLLVNHEVFVQDHSPHVFSRLDERWRVIEDECRTQQEDFAQAHRLPVKPE